MKKTTTLILVLLVNFAVSLAQTNCLNWNEYVDHKNTGVTGYYSLIGGEIEKVAQTYHYSGPGNITDIRIDGNIPLGIGWSFSALLKVSLYNVDADNRPTTLISSNNLTWFYGQTSRTVNFGGGGVSVNKNFAITVELLSPFAGQRFQVQYTGDGEGKMEDLPSIAGTSTGSNWVSLLPTKDGDLYLIPRVNHFITSNFSASATCNVAVNQAVDFTNLSLLTTDSMFNTIGLSGYTGSESFYKWNFGDGSAVSTATNPSHTFTTAGVYTVSLTSSIDGWPMGGTACTDTKTMKISVGLAVTGTPTNLTCYNNKSGSIQLTASGGDNSMYMYRLLGKDWQTSPTFSGLAIGTYFAFVKDGLGCIKAASSIIISQPNPITIANLIGVTTATCGNSDGALLATASGGVGTLWYSKNNTDYQTTGSFTGLPAGNYTVFAKDENNCIATKNVVINNTTAPSLTLQSYTNVSCNNGSDGTITLIGSGGTGTLNYSIDGENFQASGDFTGLQAGAYTPIVRDAAQCIGSIPCTTTCDIVITEPTSISFNLTQTATLCNGSNNGQIDVVDAIGGIGTLTYSIDGTNFQSGTNFAGLSAGNYTVTVKDIAGCMATNTITVTEPDAMVATISASSNLSCFNSQDGTISIAATGGNGTYFYSINGVNFFPVGIFNSLNAGTYNVTVKDGNNCTGTTSVTLTQPTIITSGITTGNSTCGNANGTILAIAAGGSGAGYTYSIDGGTTTNGTGSFSGLADSTYLVIITDDQNCRRIFTAIVTDSDGPVIANSTSTDVTCKGGNDGTVSITSVTGGTGTILYSMDGGQFQSSNVITGLTAGEHIVVVKDANSCTGELSVTLTEPSGITIVLSSTNVTCGGGANGSITVSAAGGAGTLAYSLDGINFQSTNKFNNLSAQTYNVTVRDAGGCTAVASISISQPTALSVSHGILNVSCKGGTNGAINASAFGGTGAIQYSLGGVNYQASGLFRNLSAGSYALYAKDAAGCIKAYIIVITEPNELVLTSAISGVSCAGGDNGVIDITVSGGTMPYTYSWSTARNNEDIFNLVAGNYGVTAVDANGCNTSKSFTITEPTNPIVINGVINNASSPTASDGSIDIVVTGGTLPYAYFWSNGLQTEDLSSLLPGVYVINVSDANNCETTTSFTVAFGVSIRELENKKGLNIYPNPAKELINIELEGDKLASRIVLINLTGQVVYEANPNSNKIKVSSAIFDEGLYFINIYIDKEIITRKIIITK